MTTPVPTSLEEELQQLTKAFTASLNAAMAHVEAKPSTPPTEDAPFVPLGLAAHFIDGLDHPALKQAAQAALDVTPIATPATATTTEPVGSPLTPLSVPA